MADDLIPLLKSVPSKELYDAVPKRLSEAVGETLADVWQILVGDKVSAFRLKNLASINEKLTAKVAEKGVELNWERVPERFAVSWFEKAANEDDDSIQDLFATLLANAGAENQDALQKRNVEIVSKLSPSDAILLKNVSENYQDQLLEGGDLELDDWWDFYRKTEGEDEKIEEVSLENLLNLGVVEIEKRPKIDYSILDRLLDNVNRYDGRGNRIIDVSHEIIYLEDIVRLTITGRSLLNALLYETQHLKH